MESKNIFQIKFAFDIKNSYLCYFLKTLTFYDTGIFPIFPKDTFQ